MYAVSLPGITKSRGRLHKCAAGGGEDKSTAGVQVREQDGQHYVHVRMNRSVYTLSILVRNTVSHVISVR